MVLRKRADIQLPDYLTIPVSIAKSAGQIVDWGHTYLKASEFYKHSKGENAIIFILDTIHETNHPDLVDNQIKDYNRNFAGSTNKHHHGTHCAGIACASDNGQGVIGIAPKAGLSFCAVLGDNGSGSSAGVAKAIRYVADLELTAKHAGKKKIISLSLGAPSASSAMEDAINYAIEKGCFLVAAAGNSGDGQNTIGYPGRYEQMITVASIAKNGQPSSFSSAGKQIDVAAPGSGVYSTHANGGYAYLSGTSMACPQVAGAAALIVSHYKEIQTQAQLEAFLEEHAQDIFKEGEDNRTGAGLPRLDGYLDRIPDEDPDQEPDPEEPIEEEPKREKRIVKLPFYNQTFFFKPSNSASFEEIVVSEIVLKVETNRFTDRLFNDLQEDVVKFFTNRGIFGFTTDVDYEDGLYWIGRFVEIILGKQYSIQVDEVRGRDRHGRVAIIDAHRYKQALKPRQLKKLDVATFTAPQGFVYKGSGFALDHL